MRDYINHCHRAHYYPATLLPDHNLPERLQSDSKGQEGVSIFYLRGFWGLSLVQAPKAACLRDTTNMHKQKEGTSESFHDPFPCNNKLLWPAMTDSNKFLC